MSLHQIGNNLYLDFQQSELIRNNRGAYRVSIDPGVRGTGLAFWNECGWGDPNQRPFRVQAIIPPAKMKWRTASRFIMNHVNAALQCVHQMDMTVLYIEQLEYRGTAHGEAVAARGDLQKLGMITGMLMSWSWYCGAKLRPYKVSEWKGQLPKKVCEQRIIQRYPEMADYKLADHAFDAVGIGMYAKGTFE